MKKIYSFMLLAAAMLLSINANAAFADAKALQDALNGASNGETIYLNGDLQMSSTILLDLQDKSVTLDLTGNTISFNGSGKAVDMFHLYRGKLTVKNGVITHAGSTSGTPLIFMVYGTGEKVAAGNYTHLTINEDVQLFVSGGGSDKKGYGISINERDSIDSTKHPEYPTSLPSTKVNGVALANGIRLDVHGYVEMMSDKGYCVKVNGSIKYAPAHWDKLGVTNPTATDTTEWVACAPHVYLHSTAHLVANASSTGVGAIYAAGYGVWDIRCVAEGSCALAAKSGEINVVDAVLKSTATEYNIPAGLRAGVETQGTAVLIESNSSYPGYTQVTFSGDTRVEAVSGYAIEEAITTASQTKVSAIDIEGGAFIGGNEAGCIYIDDRTLSAEGTQVIIGGGSYEDRTPAQQAATDALITQIIAGSNTYTTQVATGNTSTTGSAIVITSGTTPGVQLSDLTVEGLYGISSLKSDSSINLSQVADGTTYELKPVVKGGQGDLTLGDIVMNGEDLTIIVDSGVTFTAKQLIMNDKARIIVKAGGKLIVTGEQGIIAPVVDNILVEAVEGNMGMFLFNPAVVSNKHPNGTVQLVSQGYREGGQYVWQRFGVPTFEGMYKADIKKAGHTLPTAYMYWNNNRVGGAGWSNVAADQLMNPFQGFIMTTQTSEPGAKYEMSGELYGNVPAPLAYVPGWNYFANSYTAEIDVEAFLKNIISNHSDIIEGAIQVNTSSSSNLWESVVYADLQYDETDYEKLAPMQGFITKLKIDEIFKDTINYRTMVWNPAMGIEPNNDAPARRNMIAADYTNAVVVINAAEGVQKVTLRQGEQFSNEFDNGYEASCYKNNLFNIYANAEIGEMSQIATDNLMGQTLSIESAKAATFKMTFKNLRGETLAIRDNMTGSVINMTEGEEYFFSVAPGTTADRFEIVEAAKMPTDVEMLEAAPAKKGIYTLVGQYLGENFDVLPAGIYVVNGKKVVK